MVLLWHHFKNPLVEPLFLREYVQIFFEQLHMQ